jgi:hypothetical protein
MRRRWTARLVLTVVLAATAAVAAGGVALAVTPESSEFTGKTSQRLPVTFELVGATIFNFEPELKGHCTKRRSHKTTPAITTDAGRNVPIVNGAFSGSATNGKLNNGSEVVGTATDHVNGHFTSANAATGTYSVTFRFNANAPNGLAGYRCKTGQVRFTAERL